MIRHTLKATVTGAAVDSETRAIATTSGTTRR